jgi:hypothetical protein
MNSLWNISFAYCNRTPNPGKLLQLIHPVLGPDSSWCSIIIDALDQCDSQAFEEGGFINRLLNCAPSSCRILFSSRDENNIRSHVMNWPQVRLGDEGTTQGSLRHYISWRLSQVKSAYCSDFMNPKLSMFLSEPKLPGQLLEKAQNMFLYLFYLFTSVIDARHLGAGMVHKLLLDPA